MTHSISSRIVAAEWRIFEMAAPTNPDKDIEFMRGRCDDKTMLATLYKRYNRIIEVPDYLSPIHFPEIFETANRYDEWVKQKLADPNARQDIVEDLINSSRTDLLPASAVKDNHLEYPVDLDDYLLPQWDHLSASPIGTNCCWTALQAARIRRRKLSACTETIHDNFIVSLQMRWFRVRMFWGCFIKQVCHHTAAELYDFLDAMFAGLTPAQQQIEYEQCLNQPTSAYIKAALVRYGCSRGWQAEARIWGAFSREDFALFVENKMPGEIILDVPDTVMQDRAWSQGTVDRLSPRRGRPTEQYADYLLRVNISYRGQVLLEMNKALRLGELRTTSTNIHHFASLPWPLDEQLVARTFESLRVPNAKLLLFIRLLANV